MANHCKDCDRLQPKSSGSASMRPTFHQPTIYDHFSNFQKFKQAKEEEEYIRACKEDMAKFNANFTDWQLSDTRDELEQFSTQDMARFRQELRSRGTCEHSGSGNSNAPKQPVASDEAKESSTSSCQSDGGRSLKKKASLLTISRTPVQCPIGTCGRTIGVTSVLSHYLRDHNEDYGVQCQEIFAGKRSVLIFDASTLEFRDNVCLGILAYGGDNSDSGGDGGSGGAAAAAAAAVGSQQKSRANRPAERGICMHNAFLPKPHEKYDAHLPILIMACKTSWSAILTDKQIEAKITKPQNVSQHLLVIWLVSVQTTKPIHSTLTVYDKTMSASRSAITQVRHLNESQNPSEFLSHDSNCLRLNRGEIQILTCDETECINLEIMINEYDQ